MPDLIDLILRLTRIQNDLRYLDAHADQYPANGHRDAIHHLTTLMQGEVTHWMRRGDDTERRHETRRHDGERRQIEERRQHDRRNRDDVPTTEVA